MKKPSVIGSVCLIGACLVVFSASLDARAQTDAGRRDACCSNFRVYAESMLEELNKICSAHPGVAETKVMAFIKAIDVKKLTNVEHECSNIDPKLKVGSNNPELHGCYDPRYLLQIYAKYFGEGHEICSPSASVTISIPCDSNNPTNGCSNTVIVMPTEYKPVGGTGLMGPTGPTTKPGVDVGPGFLTDLQAPATTQPQVPTDSVFGTGVGLQRPSEARLTSVQVPLAVTENGTYGTVGASFYPFKIYQLEASQPINCGKSNDSLSFLCFLSQLNISLGATSSPGVMDERPSNDGAWALSFQHANDRDPQLNQKLGDCLREKAEEFKRRIEAECKDETCKAKKVKEEKLVIREAFRECLKDATKRAAASVLGMSSELTKFWYTYEGSYDWYFSWLIYGGMQYNFHQDVFVPMESGGQLSLMTPSLSGFVDFSMMLGRVDGYAELRPSGGMGISLPAFGGLAANFGIRLMPLPWHEDWSWDTAFNSMERRYIVGLGWAGEDAATQFYAQALKHNTP